MNFVKFSESYPGQMFFIGTLQLITLKKFLEKWLLIVVVKTIQGHNWSAVKAECITVNVFKPTIVEPA